LRKAKVDPHVQCIAELEALAGERLAKSVFDYYAGGAGDELTLKDNVLAFDRIRLRPRMLVDVSDIDMSTNLFGCRIEMPILVAPMAFQRLAHEEGEIGMAGAAAKHKTIMVASTLSTCTLEEIAESAKDRIWFQLYVYKDRDITLELVKRAEKAGYRAIVVTVDSPVLGRRLRDMHNQFQLPDHVKISNLRDRFLEQFPVVDHQSGLAAYIASLYDRSLSWKDLQWIVELTELPVLVKGVLRGDDAESALHAGAAGIVVSNHGGRQLDTTIASIDALSEVVQAVQGKIPVLVDGGIRRGTDVIKALAIGAAAVLVGRPLLWGLSLGGADGVELVLDIFKDELANAMQLAGAADIKALTPDLLAARS